MRSLGRFASALATLALCAGVAVGAPARFTIASATFRDNAFMPKSTVYDKGGCRGGNRSPELHWTGAPKATKSFALVAHDPDAPAPGGWYHWVAYNIPPTTRNLAFGARVAPGQLGTTSFGATGYGGPCPPPGNVHHYRFTLYALNEPSLRGSALTGPQVEAAVRGHILAQTVTIGLYKQ